MYNNKNEQPLQTRTQLENSRRIPNSTRQINEQQAILQQQAQEWADLQQAPPPPARLPISVEQLLDGVIDPSDVPGLTLSVGAMQQILEYAQAGRKLDRHASSFIIAAIGGLAELALNGDAAANRHLEILDEFWGQSLLVG